jgi:hypothetical protein
VGGSVSLKIAALTGVFALLLGFWLHARNGSAITSKAVSGASLGLQVKRDGTKFLISWNRSVSDIASGKNADLVIWDTSRAGWDGSSEPLFLPLTPAQLRLGSMTYTSFSFAEKVKFQMEVTGASGIAFNESILSRAPALPDHPAPAPQEAASRPAPSQPVAREPVARRVESQPIPAAQPRDSPPARSWQATAKPAQAGPVRADRVVSFNPFARRFVPPVPGARSTVTSEASESSASAMPVPPPVMPHTVTPLELPSLATTGPAEQFSPVAPSSTGEQSSAGVITITSEPSGANVEINSVPAGVTPLTLQVMPIGLGFTVTVSKGGYLLWMVQSIATVQPEALHARLTRTPK